MKQTTAFPRNE